jgi:hypothetical protein
VPRVHEYGSLAAEIARLTEGDVVILDKVAHSAVPAATRARVGLARAFEKTQQTRKRDLHEFASKLCSTKTFDKTESVR